MFYEKSDRKLARSHIWLVFSNPGRVLKKRVSGFDSKKPGYPGSGSGFQKYKIWCQNHDFFSHFVNKFWYLLKIIHFWVILRFSKPILQFFGQKVAKWSKFTKSHDFIRFWAKKYQFSDFWIKNTNLVSFFVQKSSNWRNSPKYI